MEPNVEGFGQIHSHICQILTRSKVCTLLVSSAGLTPLISPVSGKLNCVRIRIFFLATLFFFTFYLKMVIVVLLPLRWKIYKIVILIYCLLFMRHCESLFEYF